MESRPRRVLIVICLLLPITFGCGDHSQIESQRGEQEVGTPDRLDESSDARQEVTGSKSDLVLSIKLGMTRHEVERVVGSPELERFRRSRDYTPAREGTQEQVVARQVKRLMESAVSCYYPSVGLWFSFNYHGQLCRVHAGQSAQLD